MPLGRSEIEARRKAAKALDDILGDNANSKKKPKPKPEVVKQPAREVSPPTPPAREVSPPTPPRGWLNGGNEAPPPVSPEDMLADARRASVVTDPWTEEGTSRTGSAGSPSRSPSHSPGLGPSKVAKTGARDDRARRYKAARGGPQVSPGLLSAKEGRLGEHPSAHQAHEAEYSRSFSLGPRVVDEEQPSEAYGDAEEERLHPESWKVPGMGAGWKDGHCYIPPRDAKFPDLHPPGNSFCFDMSGQGPDSRFLPVLNVHQTVPMLSRARRRGSAEASHYADDWDEVEARLYGRRRSESVPPRQYMEVVHEQVDQWEFQLPQVSRSAQNQASSSATYDLPGRGLSRLKCPSIGGNRRPPRRASCGDNDEERNVKGTHLESELEPRVQLPKVYKGIQPKQQRPKRRGSVA